MAYGYNAVGNILAIDNQIAPPTTPMQGAVQPVPSLQTYAYDPLDRLTLAQGWTTDRKKLERYTLSFGYDGIHNITQKTQAHWLEINNKRLDQRKTSYDWAYQYASAGGAKPHAPIHIGERSFRYDANGNRTAGAGTFSYDQANRLTSATVGGVT